MYPSNVGDLKALALELFVKNNVPESFLEDIDFEMLCSASSASVIMISSVVGGFLAQEILKAVSSSGEPMFNVFEFDGMINCGRSFATNGKNPCA